MFKKIGGGGFEGPGDNMAQKLSYFPDTVWLWPPGFNSVHQSSFPNKK